MTSALKLAVAVVCLVGIAALVAFDMVRSAPAEVPAAPPPAAPVAVVVPVAPPEPEKKPAPAIPAPEPTATPVVVVPPPVKKAAPILIETLPGGARVYTVVQGDTLYGISVKVFGSPRHYERIYEANREKIGDPNTLQIGLKLALPDAPAKAGPGEPVPISSTK